MNYNKYTTLQVMKKSERAEIVFAAINGLEQPVVIKRLTGVKPELYREVANIDNPHIPKIYCVEEQEDTLFVAEEYVDGRTLNVYLQEEVLSEVQKLELMMQLCDAVEVLHKCIPPVIHRDIKPSNILITPEGVLKLIDFDAARRYNAEKNTSDTRLLGTIEYAAPEQFGYSQTDLRSDIYSIGVVFSELNIGKEVPFAKEWKRLVDKCTSFDPENRYKNVAELKKDVQKCLGVTRRKRMVLVWSAVGAAMLLFLTGGLLLNYNVEKDAAELSYNIAEPTNIAEFTATPEPARKAESKRVIGEHTETVGYLISKMDYVESNNMTYRINDSGSATFEFDKIYGSILFELPDIIDMNYCVDVMARIKSPVGDLAVILYDENGTAVDTFYVDRMDETKEVFFKPKFKGKVAYVGFMANDGELDDYSEFAATVYYVDFMVIHPDTPKISYTMAELAEENYYFMERTYNKDGSVTMNFERLYGELLLRFPEEIDLRKCIGIGVVMESEAGDISMKFCDREENLVEAFYDYTTDGVEEKLLNPLSGAKIGMMGLMIDDQELEDFSDCTATVYRVNFYLKE